MKTFIKWLEKNNIKYNVKEWIFEKTFYYEIDGKYFSTTLPKDKKREYSVVNITTGCPHSFNNIKDMIQYIENEATK